VDGGIVIGLLLALLAIWAFLIVVLWLVRPRDVRLAELVRVVPDLVRLVRSLLTDRSAPLGVRLALVGLLAWLVNPIDVIPEFVPVLGPLDDVIVAVLVLRYVRRRLGSEELSRRWPGTPDVFRLLSRILGG
jgi:uncharacterized membrane protein YkvA (DUF1232 family)